MGEAMEPIEPIEPSSCSPLQTVQLQHPITLEMDQRGDNTAAGVFEEFASPETPHDGVHTVGHNGHSTLDHVMMHRHSMSGVSDSDHLHFDIDNDHELGFATSPYRNNNDNEHEALQRA